MTPFRDDDLSAGDGPTRRRPSGHRGRRAPGLRGIRPAAPGARWLTLQLVIGNGGGSADQTGALAQLAGTAAGKALLWVLLAGFVLLGLWQVTEAVARSGKHRIKPAAKTVVYAALAFSTVSVLQGSSSSSDQQTQSATARLMAQPAGVWAVGWSARWSSPSASSTWSRGPAPGSSRTCASTRTAGWSASLASATSARAWPWVPSAGCSPRWRSTTTRRRPGPGRRAAPAARPVGRPGGGRGDRRRLRLLRRVLLRPSPVRAGLSSAPARDLSVGDRATGRMTIVSRLTWCGRVSATRSCPRRPRRSAGCSPRRPSPRALRPRRSAQRDSSVATAPGCTSITRPGAPRAPAAAWRPSRARRAWPPRSPPGYTPVAAVEVTTALPPAGGLDQGQQRLRHTQRAQDVDVVHPLPVGTVAGLHRVKAQGATGDVHQGGQASCGLDPPDERGDVRIRRHVGRDRGAPRLGRERLEAIGAAGDRDDVSVLGAQPPYRLRRRSPRRHRSGRRATRRFGRPARRPTRAPARGRSPGRRRRS